MSKSPRTQKAKSVIYGCPRLNTSINNSRIRMTSECSSQNNLAHLIQSMEDIQRITPKFWENNPKIFARPCPLTPRHGFVDSRVISSSLELKNLFDEVQSIDPEGEILLMRFLDKAHVNAILSTSGVLSVGPGHDGATSGKNSFSIPVNPETLHYSIMHWSGLPEDSNVFIEAVIAPISNKHRKFNLTQVRGGPSIPAVKDFIPNQITVNKVVEPNDDLVAWESEVKGFAPGTVVFGAGHTLASHAAIHCVLNNIPFITTKAPNIGDVLSPTEERQYDLDLNSFRLGTTLGMRDSVDITHMLHMSACVVHNWAYLRKSEHASWLLGLAASYFTKVMCALCFGEHRHFTEDRKKISRDQIYKEVITTNRVSSYLKKSPKIASKFLDPLTRISGYGGLRWAAAVKSQILIWNSVVDINEQGINDETVRCLMENLNKAVNLLHNNGWLFNKISEKDMLDDIAHKPGLSMLQFSDVLFDNYTKLQSIKYIRKMPRIDVEDIVDPENALEPEKELNK
jgi:hypothetical protein